MLDQVASTEMGFRRGASEQNTWGIFVVPRTLGGTAETGVSRGSGAGHLVHHHLLAYVALERTLTGLFDMPRDRLSSLLFSLTVRKSCVLFG